MLWGHREWEGHSRRSYGTDTPKPQASVTNGQPLEHRHHTEKGNKNMTHIVLVDSAAGALFTVSNADWTAIDQRVASAIQFSDIAGTVSQYLPGFEALVRACRAWRDHTFVEIGLAAECLVGYCGDAVREFGGLRAALAGGDLTPALQHQVVDTVTALSVRTTTLNQQFHLVAGAVADFMEINQTVDRQVDKFVAQLGTDWKSILPATGRVDAASGRVRGIWQALSADLNALVSGQIEVDKAFVASLQIDQALLGWTDLQAEAEAFSPGAARRGSATIVPVAVSCDRLVRRRSPAGRGR